MLLSACKQGHLWPVEKLRLPSPILCLLWAEKLEKPQEVKAASAIFAAEARRIAHGHLILVIAGRLRVFAQIVHLSYRRNSTFLMKYVTQAYGKDFPLLLNK